MSVSVNPDVKVASNALHYINGDRRTDTTAVGDDAAIRTVGVKIIHLIQCFTTSIALVRDAKTV